jgi:GGDEF domain-containing protein
VLADLAGVLRTCVRQEDTVGRYGGDEFVVLAPDTDEAAAGELADRLREAIRATVRLPDGPLDVSIGVAQWRLGSAADDLLAAADAALLAAKAAGGATVIRATELETDAGPPSAPRDERTALPPERSSVRFCGHCGYRPPGANGRVCAKCGLGVVISVPADAVPARDDPFLILDAHMTVGALSRRAASVLGITEGWALHRHVDEFLAADIAQDPTVRTLGTVLGRTARGERAPRDLQVRLRTEKNHDAPFGARIAACGPPAGTLIVLTQPTGG